MALSTENTYLTSLIQAGSDAMSNLYLVELSGGVFDTDNSLIFKVRNQDFNPPTFIQNKDTKNYLTVGIDVPGAGISGEKSFDLTIRLDSNYRVYAALLKQQSLTMSGNDGWAINEVPNSNDTSSGFTVTLKAYQKNDTYTVDDEESYIDLYVFKHCWIKSIAPISYTYDSNSPLAVRVTIPFMEYEDPMNKLLNGED